MTAARHLVPIDEVASLLASRIDMLTRELLPHGKRDGHEWRCGSVHGEPGGSLGVHLHGAKAGVWADFSTGETGDALDLVAACLFRGNKADALSWSRAWLGLDGGDPRVLQQRRAEARQASEQRAEDAAKEAAETRNNAFRIWLSAQESIADTPVEAYLRGRGIDLRTLGRQPRALRFHPRLWNAESRRHWPAMTAAVHDGVGHFVAVHRTFLEILQDGRVRKAPLENPKLTLGSFKGGMIRLWRGASGKRLADASEPETVNVTEGIEDGLSVAMALPEGRVVAGVSLGNIGNLVFPDTVAAVVLWKQNDTNPKALAAADRALQALLARGVRVTVPEIPAPFKDVNEWLCGENA